MTFSNDAHGTVNCRGVVEVRRSKELLQGNAPSLQFPFKLHRMLEDAEMEGNSNASTISWLPGGHAFKVHDPIGFVEHVMPRYFEGTKYKSFQRSLNLWSFKRINSGPEKGGYGHPLFIRSDKPLCSRIRRATRPKPKCCPARKQPALASSQDEILTIIDRKNQVSKALCSVEKETRDQEHATVQVAPLEGHASQKKILQDSIRPDLSTFSTQDLKYILIGYSLAKSGAITEPLW